MQNYSNQSDDFTIQLNKEQMERQKLKQKEIELVKK